MSCKKAIGVVLAAFCLLGAGEARAEQWTRKSFLMPEGSFEITGDPARPAMLEINASRNSFAEPVFVKPHFYWAVTNDLSIGISHQRGLCLNGCDKVYNDAGFDLMYYLTGSDKFELDLHAGVPVGSFSPFVHGRSGRCARARQHRRDHGAWCSTRPFTSASLIAIRATRRA